jgi:hypothetical protein
MLNLLRCFRAAAVAWVAWFVGTVAVNAAAGHILAALISFIAALCCAGTVAFETKVLRRRAAQLHPRWYLSLPGARDLAWIFLAGREYRAARKRILARRAARLRVPATKESLPWPR